MLCTEKRTYRKVVSSRLSRLVAHSRIFRLFMKGKFDAYVLWPLTKRVQNWIVDRSTARDFTVCTMNHSSSKGAKVNFSCQESFELFWFFFKLRICNSFLMTSIFETRYFLKLCSIFDELPFIVFTKIFFEYVDFCEKMGRR